MRSPSPARPRAPPRSLGRAIGVVKFASCDGCQLTLLDLEVELLAIAERVDVVEFAEATSQRSAGPFDVLFVEGSISTPEQAEEIARLRAARVAGDDRRLRDGGRHPGAPQLVDHDGFGRAVYPDPEYVESLATSTPVADYVAVDAELRGCPIYACPAARAPDRAGRGRRPHTAG